MRKSARLALAAALACAAPLSLAPANAAGMHHDMMGDSMHPMMHGKVTCKAGAMTDTGMMVEFHNMGSAEIPAGSMVHFMIRGMAQGDLHLMEALAPGAMKSQNYMMHDAHMAGDMMHTSANAPCTAEMK